ncbi:unnamed protein product [Mytilus edulis]|uniref:Uncharacterized protein n=1 Tax=Mytilus edulis TaxID=6550 RepID=A0A8S3SE90_MYTED|nr:unnamed protein product [Mytilus edulis]
MKKKRRKNLKEKEISREKEMIKKLIEEENRKHNKSDKSSKPKTSKPRKSKPIEETDGDAFEHRYNEKKISKKQRRADYKTHNSSQDDSAEEEDSQKRVDYNKKIGRGKSIERGQALIFIFPGKLQLMDVMKIESNVKPVRFDEIALKFIHNLVMINFTCRDKMVHDQIEVLRREKLEVTEDESKEADYLDDLLSCDIKDDNIVVMLDINLLDDPTIENQLRVLHTAGSGMILAIDAITESKNSVKRKLQKYFDSFLRRKLPFPNSAVKDDVVPLQGKLWRTWSEKLKNVNKASEHKTLQELGTIRDEMKNERIQQLQICENLRPLMKLFLFNLAELISSDHDCIVFVLWLKQYLDDRSRNTLPKLLSKYQSDWQALKAARDKREMKDVDSMRKQLDQSEYNLAEASFDLNIYPAKWVNCMKQLLNVQLKRQTYMI